ncbi:MAG: extracellular solute-binding protein [Spirochaetales bacterium]|jgi:putative aldouronate transport system substrate-binding protein|nr:extracellular solute-binding protein [Spirochaetales bacterium]
MKTRKSILVWVLIVLLPAVMWATGASESTDSGEPPELSIFNNRPARQAMPEGVDFWDNVYINYIRESSGINPIYMRPERSTYNDKLTLVMSSGDMPDLVQGNFAQLYKYVDDGLVVPLDDLLKEHGQDILANMPENMWKHVTVDGKIYGLPAVYFYPVPGKDSIPNRVLWVRKDWINSVGVDDPVTLDEFTDMMRKFRDSDPDGNGKADTMGISAFIRDGDLRGLDPIFGAFGVIQTGGQWTDINGKVVYNTVRPEMKKALAYLNGIYEEGLLDPEFYLNDQGAWMERVYQGTIGTWLGSWWEPKYRTDTIIKNTGVANMTGGLVKPIHTPVGSDGYSGNAATLSLAEGVYFVTIDADDPAVAVKFYNWRFSDAGKDYDFGFKGTNFSVVDGVRVKSADTPVDGYARAYHTSYVPWGEPDFRQYVIDSTGKDPDIFEIAWKALEVSADDGITSAVPYYQAPSMVEYGAELQKLWVEYAVKIITGEFSLDKWDEYVGLWKKNGGDDITAEMNEFYSSQK